MIPGMSEASGRNRVPWALRGMIAASVIVPLLVLAGGSWVAWRDTIATADADLRDDLAVASEQTARVLDSHVLLGGRVNDLLGNLTDDEVVAGGQELHDKLVAMIAGYGQITAVVVTGKDGSALVGSSRYPTDHRINFADRGYFTALRDGTAPFEIGGIVVGRLTHEPLFSVAIRRGNNPKQFAGVIM